MENCVSRLGELLSKTGLSFATKTGLDCQECKTVNLTCCHLVIYFREENNKIDFMAYVDMARGGEISFHSECRVLEDLPGQIFDCFLEQKAEREARITKFGLVPKEQADRAAKWWSDQLQKKGFKNLYRVDEEGIDLVLALEAKLQEKEITDRIVRFEQLLSEKIQTEIADERGVTLKVDYHPEDLLAEAWEESSTEADRGFGRFPWKTQITVYKDRIVLDDPYFYNAETKKTVLRERLL